MIIDRNNMMVGSASHIREVGPHLHTWNEVGRDRAGFRYFECGSCGARRTDYPLMTQAERASWLCGGAWKDDAAEAHEDEPPKLEAPATPEQAAAVEAVSTATAPDADGDSDDDEDDDEALPVRRRGRPRKSPVVGP